MTISTIMKCLAALLISGLALAQDHSKAYDLFLHENAVRINGMDWKIKPFEKATDFKDLDGYTSCASHTIYWRTPKYQTTQWIVWHELLHAGACYGPKYDGHYWDNPNVTEHRGIYRLTAYLYEVTRDNPELAQWLIESGK